MTNIISEAFEKFIEECLKNYEISPNFEKLVLIADSQTNGRFTPLIKIIKHWNGRIGDIMDPLFLEAVALCIFYKSPLKSKKLSQYPKFKRFDDFPKALKMFFSSQILIEALRNGLEILPLEMLPLYIRGNKLPEAKPTKLKEFLYDVKNFIEDFRKVEDSIRYRRVVDEVFPEHLGLTPEEVKKKKRRIVEYIFEIAGKGYIPDVIIDQMVAGFNIDLLLTFNDIGAIKNTASKITEAIELSNTSPERAMEIWRNILGNCFPSV
ncbi:MAG: hypothetical protein AB1353_05255 [Aquificota bacterium]